MSAAVTGPKRILVIEDNPDLAYIPISWCWT